MKSRARRSSSVARPRLAVVVPSPRARARRSSRALQTHLRHFTLNLRPKTQPSSPRRTTPWRTVRSSRIVAKAPASFRPRPKVSPRARSPPSRARASPSRPSPSPHRVLKNFPRTFTSPPLAPFALAVAYVRCEASSSVSPRASRSRLRAPRRASPSRDSPRDSRRVASREFRRARSRTSSVDRAVAHRASRRSIASSACAGPRARVDVTR